MKGLAFAAVSMLSVQPAEVYRGEVFDGLPPDRYQFTNTAQVEFVDDLNVETACGTPPAGKRFLGCVRYRWSGKRIIMPNPCGQPGDYARILCHELGHVNGWTGNHEY